MTKEKLYLRYDMQDESDYVVETLDDIKAWISEFWTFNHSDDISEDELDDLLERIEEADEDELQSIVWGIDYDFTEYIEEEMK